MCGRTQENKISEPGKIPAFKAPETGPTLPGNEQDALKGFDVDNSNIDSQYPQIASKISDKDLPAEGHHLSSIPDTDSNENENKLDDEDDDGWVPTPPSTPEYDSGGDKPDGWKLDIAAELESMKRPRKNSV
ncbi:hypothetical protein FRB95_002420 [Tulasnella sp. JGI-2019a]|nr:hypothetical protein FRB95_002420 [Tulasnella sp. JGI-2019a]